MESRVGISAEDRHPAPPFVPPQFCRKREGIRAGGPRQITHRAGDDRKNMPTGGEVTSEFVVASPTGFVKRGKSLMDE